LPMRAHYARTTVIKKATASRHAQYMVCWSLIDIPFAVERILGKAEVDSSILSGGTIFPKSNKGFGANHHLLPQLGAA